MELLKTDRLIIKSIQLDNEESFFQLFSDPIIINPIPQPSFSNKIILELFQNNLNLNESSLKKRECIFGIFEKQKTEMIGLSLFLINKKNENELGYRFKQKHWGKGYGTEIAKGMLNYYFSELNVCKLIVEVSKENIGSIKILNKFMKPIYEYYNKKCNCVDVRYEINKNDWLNNNL